jgi:hypothetical protein
MPGYNLSFFKFIHSCRFEMFASINIGLNLDGLEVLVLESVFS